MEQRTLDRLGRRVGAVRLGAGPLDPGRGRAGESGAPIGGACHGREGKR